MDTSIGETTGLNPPRPHGRGLKDLKQEICMNRIRIAIDCMGGDNADISRPACNRSLNPPRPHGRGLEGDVVKFQSALA